ncbi:MAG: GNAT family N-acetyltransferase [Saprospiraceae bacterium]
MKILNSTTHDIDTIFDLYEKARNLQRIKWIDNLWPEFEVAMIETEIENNQQWKLLIDGQIACIWVTAFSDPKIWEERDIDPSVYIHRIATSPDFRGRNLVQTIVNWAANYAKSNEKHFVRLDTCGHNQGLINYYQKCGFKFLGIWKLKDTQGLPSHYVDSDVCFFEIDLR